MALSASDAQAIAGLAGRLGVDPASLGGLMKLESGINPNIWGGAGGAHKGLIQFGPEARKEVGLPDRDMTIAEQIPYVEKYFNQRGFTPGKHGVTEMYRTVLVGNPHQSGTDSFGTNSDKAAARMRPGGDLYEWARAKLGGASGGGDIGFSTSGIGGTTPAGEHAPFSPPSVDPVAVDFGEAPAIRLDPELQGVSGILDEALNSAMSRIGQPRMADSPEFRQTLGDLTQRLRASIKF
jgi:hypothetical protein